MKKRLYEKPRMRVVELNQQPQLLAGSSYPPDWNGPIGYTPGISADVNKLA